MEEGGGDDVPRKSEKECTLRNTVRVQKRKPARKKMESSQPDLGTTRTVDNQVSGAVS